MEPPILYIIAGPNGAGKTTASMNILPEVLNCRIFVNADEIAKGLNPLDPSSVNIEAGKMMLERINQLVERKDTFAIETTLATKSYVGLITRAKSAGYKVVLLYFWLESPYYAKERVKMRVKEGGHDIPEEVVERRYWSGLANFFELFAPIVDWWALYDNNGDTKLIANKKDIIDFDIYSIIIESCQNRKK